MQKTKIPWCDYTVNPVKGLCPVACPYCYARRMYKRFKWDPEIRYELNVWNDDFNSLPRGSKIFVGSTIDLFHEKTIQYMPDIIEAVKFWPHLTFIFLTKCPQNLAKFSPFPDNAWVGTTITRCWKDGFTSEYLRRVSDLGNIRATVKFISFEPLLDWFGADKFNLTNGLQRNGINWIILGSRTKPTLHPKREWVESIIAAADRAKIPVFIKPPLFEYLGIHRVEMPEGVK